MKKVVGDSRMNKNVGVKDKKDKVVVNDNKDNDSEEYCCC